MEQIRLGHSFDQRRRLGLKPESEPLLKANGPEHPCRVLNEAQAMQDTDCLLFQVSLTSIEINELTEMAWIETDGQRIDREVAAIEIFFNRTSLNGRQSSRVFIVFGSGGGNVQLETVREDDDGRLKATMDIHFRLRRSGQGTGIGDAVSFDDEIQIQVGSSQEQIAHKTPDHKSRHRGTFGQLPCLFQYTEYPARETTSQHRWMAPKRRQAAHSEDVPLGFDCLVTGATVVHFQLKMSAYPGSLWVCGRLVLGVRHIAQISSTAETQPVHLRVGIGPVALGRTNAGGAVNPPATTKGLLRPLLRPLRIAIRRRLVIVRVVPVGRPFRHIAGHLKDSIGADRVLVLVHRDDRWIEQQSLRPVADRPGQAGTAEVGPAQSCWLVAPWIDAPVLAARRLLPLRRRRHALPRPLA